MHGNFAIVLRVAHYQQDSGSLKRRPCADLVKKFHGVRRMGQGRKACMMQGCDQETCGDADRLWIVVMAEFRAILVQPIFLRKDRDQRRCVLQKGLA